MLIRILCQLKILFLLFLRYISKLFVVVSIFDPRFRPILVKTSCFLIIIQKEEKEPPCLGLGINQYPHKYFDHINTSPVVLIFHIRKPDFYLYKKI